MSADAAVTHTNFVLGEPLAASEVARNFEDLEDWINAYIATLDGARAFRRLISSSAVPTTANHLSNLTYWQTAFGTATPIAVGANRTTYTRSGLVLGPGSSLAIVPFTTAVENTGGVGGAVGIGVSASQSFGMQLGQDGQYMITVWATNTSSAATFRIRVNGSAWTTTHTSTAASVQNATMTAGCVFHHSSAASLSAIVVSLFNDDGALSGTFDVGISILKVSD